MVAGELSVLVLTEDTGDAAHAVTIAIARKLLFLIEPGLDDRRLRFSRADERARAGMGFLCYKSRSPRDYDKKLRLAQAIANHVLRGDAGSAVFVHIDADRRWSERDSEHLCDNVHSFNEEILQRVRAMLESRGQGEKIEHIALLVPFWSIESWLFHNTAEAIRICEETHPRHADARPCFERWRAEPGALDELERPKGSSSFGALYNQRLAENGFPARRVQQLGLSFADSVARAKGSRIQALIARFARDPTSTSRS